MSLPENTALSGKVALVTGASRGIGRAIAIELARCGAAVAANYQNNRDQAEEVVGHITATGGKAIAVGADVSEAEAVDAMVDQVIAELGGLDILVNNAGINRDGLLVRMSSANWDDVLKTNLTGTFHCLQRCAKHMMRQRYGRIINVSSVVGVEGNAGQANYAAAKAGIIGLTRSAAKELASRGITVNAVAPGFIETDMTDGLKEEQKELVLKQIPLARFGKADEVAGVVAFLCSDQAAYVTGTVLRIDGGIMM